MMSIRRVCWTCAKADSVAGDALRLGRRIDPRRRLHLAHQIAPESLTHAEIRGGLLERSPYIRYMLKECDVLLRVQGELSLSFFFNGHHARLLRSRDQIMHEVAVGLGGRYLLVEEKRDGDICRIRLRKNAATLPHDDSIDRWTFGIVSNGQKNPSVIALCDSIFLQRIPKFEVLICGPDPYPPGHRPPSVRILEDVVPKDARGPISEKKNRIISAATYNNLCILHDRFVLPPTWHERMRAYGSYFDLLVMRLIGPEGKRAQDWASWPGRITDLLRRAPYTMSYEEWSPYWFAQGGVILGKKHLIERFKMDERLHWAELEDIHFSKLADLFGLLCYLDVDNHFVTNTHRTGTYFEETPPLATRIRFFLGTQLHLMKQWLAFCSYRLRERQLLL